MCACVCVCVCVRVFFFNFCCFRFNLKENGKIDNSELAPSLRVGGRGWINSFQCTE